MRKPKRSLQSRVLPWRDSVLHQVVGQPTLGEVLDDAVASHMAAATKLNDAWQEWLNSPEIGPSEDMLEAMSEVLDAANIVWTDPEE